ncbi:MAG: purine-nucleoside phosphorylase [Saprospiraceae bacterium]|nr:purine-nucleoside phosphorylase [Saprospiraceae bacterium]HMS70429.1 purine-nucleoside phosphorylase [Saprospiraceae bacterium]
MKHIFDLDQLKESQKYISKRFGNQARTAIILGTGLGDITAIVEIKKAISYNEIPNFPISTTESHKGELILGKIGDQEVVIVSGRFHMYEGYSAAESTYIIHVLHSIGIHRLLITNAVGGVNPHYEEGDIVLVTDHINFFPENPLRGKNHADLGPKFPDMSVAYDQDLIAKATSAADQLGITIKKGVYFGWPGPSLETPAEYRMIHIVGGDIVGMSTIPEVIVARYYEMEVICFSIVSNVCFPKSKIKYTTVADVIAVVTASVHKLQPLIKHMLVH